MVSQVAGAGQLAGWWWWCPRGSWQGWAEPMGQVVTSMLAQLSFSPTTLEPMCLGHERIFEKSTPTSHKPS